jgi:hypothetical protein
LLSIPLTDDNTSLFMFLEHKLHQVKSIPRGKVELQK